MGVGLADGGSWQLTAAGVEACRTARIEAIKLNAVGPDTINQALIDRVRSIRPDIHIMVRFMGVMHDPVRFIDERLPSLQVARNAQDDEMWVEVGNEPNHHVEGFGIVHHSAEEYGRKWAQAQRRLSAVMPDVKVLFPCPSPDPSFTGAREFHTFLRASANAASAAGGRWDGWAVHAYGPPQSVINAIREFANEYGREVWVTEFSHAGVSKRQQGEEYRQIYEADYPPNVRGLYGYVLEASSGWQEETWVHSDVPRLVGQRQDRAQAA